MKTSVILEDLLEISSITVLVTVVLAGARETTSGAEDCGAS